MEEELDSIEEGAMERTGILQNFWDKFKGLLDAAAVNRKNVKRDPEKTGTLCPQCSQPMVIRFGKRGAFLACFGYPACRTTQRFERDDKGKVQVI